MCPPGADCDSFIVGVAPEASAPGLFSGPYEHRTISGGIGHNLPQEAPAPFVDAIVAVDPY